MPAEARRPGDREGDVVFSCFNQDQELDSVDFEHLADAPAPEHVQEKLTNLWVRGSSRPRAEAARYLRGEVHGEPGPEEAHRSVRRLLCCVQRNVQADVEL